MTIESSGQAYTFEGYLASTEIIMESDHSARINLDIVATGSLTREELPKRGKRVQ